MRKIKKTIKQKMIKEYIDEHTFRIIPDLSADYNIQILLSKNSYEMGVFDAYNEE